MVAEGMSYHSKDLVCLRNYIFMKFIPAEITGNYYFKIFLVCIDVTKVSEMK